jgi:molybdopterin converting factor small subunit
MGRLRIPTGLGEAAGSDDEFEIPGRTVREALRALQEERPKIARHLLKEDGTPRSYVALHVNEQDIRALAHLDTPLGTEDTLTITPSLAGG